MARFSRQGTEKWFFVPTIAVLTTGPTNTERGAGVPLTVGLNALTGFAYKGSTIDTGDFDTRQVSSIAGEEKSDASSMTWFENDDSGSAEAVAKTTLPKDTSGYIVKYPVGTGTGKPVEVWPIRVIAQYAETGGGTNEAAKFTCDFAITGIPQFHAAP